jgi:hypothetical protein
MAYLSWARATSSQGVGFCVMTRILLAAFCYRFLLYWAGGQSAKRVQSIDVARCWWSRHHINLMILVHIAALMH